jgi:hypothetical protein
VDMDIAKFFDHVNGDILMGKIAAVVRDKRVLRRIGRYLRAGAMGEGVVVKSVEGTPQGGPLSPLVGVLPTGREPPPDLRAGGMDTAPHPGMLLAEVAPPGRARAAAAQPGVAGTHAESGAEFPGGLASGGDRQPAKRALERDSAPIWLSHAIGSSGFLKCRFQPPDAENRTSGGVGGWRSAIPATRPNQIRCGQVILNNTPPLDVLPPEYVVP